MRFRFGGLDKNSLLWCQDCSGFRCCQPHSSIIRRLISLSSTEFSSIDHGLDHWGLKWWYFDSIITSAFIHYNSKKNTTSCLVEIVSKERAEEVLNIPPYLSNEESILQCSFQKWPMGGINAVIMPWFLDIHAILTPYRHHHLGRDQWAPFQVGS